MEIQYNFESEVGNWRSVFIFGNPSVSSLLGINLIRFFGGKFYKNRYEQFRHKPKSNCHNSPHGLLQEKEMTKRISSLRPITLGEVADMEKETLPNFSISKIDGTDEAFSFLKKFDPENPLLDIITK